MSKIILIISVIFLAACAENESSSEEKESKTKGSDSLSEPMDTTTTNLEETGDYPAYFVVNNPELYSEDFVGYWHGFSDSMTISSDSVMVENDKNHTILIPTALPLNEEVVYASKDEAITTMLKIKRTDYSTVTYDYSETESSKTIVQKKGVLLLMPSYYMDAPGSFEEGDEEYTMVEYVKHTEEDWFTFVTGFNNIEKAKFQYRPESEEHYYESPVLYKLAK
jgi:hypothetical protein